VHSAIDGVYNLSLGLAMLFPAALLSELNVVVMIAQFEWLTSCTVRYIQTESLQTVLGCLPTVIGFALISGLRETKDSAMTTMACPGYWILAVTIEIFGL
jgi:hypothetical protein